MTFPMALDEDDPMPLIGYLDESTGTYVPVEVKLVDGHPTVTTDHFSRWFVQDVRELTASLAKKMESLINPFPRVDEPKCEHDDALLREVEVSVKMDKTLWCMGRNDNGQTYLKVVNPKGHHLEFESTPGLVPDATDLGLSNLLEESALLAKVSSQNPDSDNTFGLIAPGQTRTFTVAGRGRHEFAVRSSDSTVFASAATLAIDGILMLLPIQEKTDEQELAGLLNTAMSFPACLDSLRQTTSAAGAKGNDATADDVISVSSAVVKCLQPLVEEKLVSTLGKTVGKVVVGAALGGLLLAMSGVKWLLSGASWALNYVKGDEWLVISMTSSNPLELATATEITTVRPFEDGTVEEAEVLDTTSVECGGDGQSIRADTTRCTWQVDGPASEAPTLVEVCFTDPSGQPRVACPARDGSWYVMEDVGELDLGIPTEKSGTASPEEGNVFRVELVGGGWCVAASGAGPTPPEGYSGWSGVCEVPGSADASVLWAPEDPLDDTTLFFTGISDDGHLQVAIGPEKGDPRLHEVTRAYR